ncbi:hypothetical protein HPB50_028686 [Hyalomma asiaticum]|nr:hypothetical protein HPB50_028686 [Hyalomma asiaticum]
MACPRLTMGWTVVRAAEDLHVPLCAFCANYGHGRSTCPNAAEPPRAVCTRCVAEGHVGANCTVRVGSAAESCAAESNADQDRSCCPAGPTASEEEDACSSVSEDTAVAIGHRADPGARMQARARELEDELSRFCADSANRITVSARNYIMSRVFELVNLCSDMRADAATERGAALALQGQLAEARREVAGLQRRVLVAERTPVGDILGGLVAAPPAVGPAPAGFPAGPGVQVARGAGPAVTSVPTYAAVVRAGGPAGVPGAGPSGPAGLVGAAAPGTVSGVRHEHAAFLTPVGATEAPARDVVRLLKANIDPVAKDIRDVTLRHTRYGVTVFTNNAQTITNMKNVINENAVTRAAMTVRVPARRNPHVRFSGVDPDLGPEEFLRLLDERNPTLQIVADISNVKVTFRERAGTKAYVVEVDPEAFSRIMASPRLSVGWTMVHASEDLHVPTCTFCASYGHGRSSCPAASDPTRAVCMRCGAEGHVGATCSVRMGTRRSVARPAPERGWRRLDTRPASRAALC